MIIKDNYITTYAINHEELAYRRATFVDPEIYTNCCQCQEIIEKTASMFFICGHYYCNFHKDLLFKNYIDTYYDYINTPCIDVSQLSFSIMCCCGSENSRNNSYTGNFYYHLVNATNIESLNQCLEFVNSYYNFFHGVALLKRCQKCSKVCEANAKANLCRWCGWCIDGNHESHAGINCQQFSSLSKNYVIDMKKPIPPPQMHESKEIVDLYSNLLNYTETTFNIPVRIVSV